MTGPQVNLETNMERKNFLPIFQNQKDLVLLLVQRSMHTMPLTLQQEVQGMFFVYLNSVLLYWLSKKQISIESNTFGSEFTSMKQCCEYLKILKYKIRMMGISCEGPAFTEGDNQSVLANTSIPDSTLKNKCQSIA